MRFQLADNIVRLSWTREWHKMSELSNEDAAKLRINLLFKICQYIRWLISISSDDVSIVAVGLIKQIICRLLRCQRKQTPLANHSSHLIKIEWFCSFFYFAEKIVENHLTKSSELIVRLTLALPNYWFWGFVQCHRQSTTHYKIVTIYSDTNAHRGSDDTGLALGIGRGYKHRAEFCSYKFKL